MVIYSTGALARHLAAVVQGQGEEDVQIDAEMIAPGSSLILRKLSDRIRAGIQTLFYNLI